MDKEEFRIKLEEINRLVENKKYREAMEVVDSIDWRRVKNVHTLCVVGEIYAANKRYEDSKEIFLLAYHRAPIGKNILYRLIEVSLKMKDIDEAMEFYEEYLEIAPNDSTQYILKYKIFKAKKAPVEEQIKILEDYKENEFAERWSYELARLYYENGDTEKCLSLCNEMILWFSEGKYVLKAMDLKNRMGKLTEKEKEEYEKQFIPKLTPVEEASEIKEEQAEAEPDADASEESTVSEYGASLIDNVRIDERDVNNAESFQEKISKSIRDIFNGKKKDTEEDSELTKEEEEISSEEMIKSSSVKEDNKNVPDLEPEIPAGEINTDISSFKETVSDITEDTLLKESEETIEEEEEEKVQENKPVKKEKSSSGRKLPELEIPESMKNFGMENPLHNSVPKAPEICLPGEEKEESQSDSDFDFNLEDTILAAASAQGIKIPEDTEKDRVPEDKENVEEKGIIEIPESEDIVTEEDLRMAEEEFLNGPSEKNQEEDVFEDFLDDENEDFTDDDGYEDMDSDGDDEEKALEKFIDSINPQDDTTDIIPREKKLTENEEKLFTYFAKVPGLREQIISTLCDVQLCAADKTSKTGNIIVMGGRETGKTRLISGLIPAICKELNLEASKVAYVFAEQINGKDIASIVSKMAGGFLVIENANQLKKDTVDQLNKAMEFRTDGLIVIIEDEKIGMRKLIARFPKFTSKFTTMINIPVFTNDELVNFAKVYTRENGYTIDQMGMLALYNQISTGQKADQPMNIGAVKEIIDGAISRSRGGIRKLKKKKVNKDGYAVLYEKDFI